MIILVKPSDYCANAIRYATEKAKAKIVKVNHMPDSLTAISMWHRMRIHCLQHEDKHTHGRPMKYSMLTLVFSPSPEECVGWKMDDWSNFYDEVLETLDAVDISKEKGCKDCVPTHFVNSMSVGALHSDSKSGKLHLHADICRLDMDGNTNQLHQLHIRAMKAAETINLRHGWTLPEDIREEHRQEVSQTCMDVLRQMAQFNMTSYLLELHRKGYMIDSRVHEGKVVGYTVKNGTSFFKASELGTGRNLMASKLEDTWKKLHKGDEMHHAKPFQPSNAPQYHQMTDEQIGTPFHRTSPNAAMSMQEHTHSNTIYQIHVGGRVLKCAIPDTVKDLFTSEAELPDDVLWSKVEDISHTAILLFCGYVDAAIDLSQSLGGGGGGSNSKNWGRDKDEDDWMFARRCLAQAKSMHQRPGRSFRR